MIRRRARGRPVAAVPPAATVETVTIPVSSLAVGAQPVNAFPGWISPATNVFASGSFGGAPGTKYISTPDNAFFMARSVAETRDQEVTTFMERGVVYLRLTPAGKAITFTLSTEVNAYGVSVSTGTTNGAGNGGGSGPGGGSTVTNLFPTPLPPISSVPGWDRTNNAGKAWTFGVEGFDVYLKYDGVEFWRTKQFWHLEPGRVAFGVHPNENTYGFRDISATFRSNIPMFSNTSAKIVDVRDLGFKKLSAIGSITAGSSTLTLTSNPGFVVGDQIIVATGGEAGGGVPGERGVGGCWPSLLYADVATMNADTTQSVGRICGVLSTGVTYIRTASAWQTVSTSGINLGSTYLDKIVPRALLATVTNVSGVGDVTLGLNTAATVSATSASVYSNCHPYWLTSLGALNNGFSTQTGASIFFPDGDWAWGAYNATVMQIAQCNNLTVSGSGRNVCSVFSPPGCSSFSMTFTGCNALTVQDITARGNFRADKGYQIRYNSLDQYGEGLINFNFTSCPNSIIRRVRAYNNQQAAVSFNFCATCNVDDLEIYHETGHKAYQQWGVNVSDCSNCTVNNVLIDCPALFTGAETFRSTGSILRNIRGRNFLLSTNSSNGFLLEDIDVYYETGCGEVFAFGFPTPGAEFVNVNTNIDNTSGSTVGGGGTIRNFRFDVQGKPWPNTSTVNVINISGTATNILIAGKYPAKPVTQPAGIIIFPTGISAARSVRSDDATKIIVVDGIRVIRTDGSSNIGNVNGIPHAGFTIRNCVIDNQAAGGTQTANMTNATYEAL